MEAHTSYHSWVWILEVQSLQHWISLYSTGWPGTYCVEQAGLQLTDLLLLGVTIALCLAAVKDGPFKP